MSTRRYVLRLHEGVQIWDNGRFPDRADNWESDLRVVATTDSYIHGVTLVQDMELGVFKWGGSDWVQVGNSVSHDHNKLWAKNIDVNSTGDRFIVSTERHSPEVTYRQGWANVVSLTGDGEWILSADIFEGTSGGGPHEPNTLMNGSFASGMRRTYFGRDCSINASGNIVAVSAPQRDYGGNSAGGEQPYVVPGGIEDVGQIIVYEVADHTSEGQEVLTIRDRIDPVPVSVNALFGKTISLDSTGDIICCLAPYGTGGSGGQSGGYGTHYFQVREWNGNEYIQRGETVDLNFLTPANGIGKVHIQMSRTGDYVIAASEPNTTHGNSGEVQVWEWDGSNYVKRGESVVYQDLSNIVTGYTSPSNDYRKVYISDDGSFFAVSVFGYKSPGNTSPEGRIVSADWNAGSSSWDFRAPLIPSAATTGQQYHFGWCMSGFGTKILVGSTYGVDAKVYVSFWNGSSWEDLGSPFAQGYAMATN